MSFADEEEHAQVFFSIILIGKESGGKRDSSSILRHCVLRASHGTVLWDNCNDENIRTKVKSGQIIFASRVFRWGIGNLMKGAGKWLC